MQGDGLTAPGSQSITQAVPDIATLARFGWCQSQCLQLGVNGLESGAVVPQNPVMLWQIREKLAGVQVLLLVGAIQTDHDLIEIRYLL